MGLELALLVATTACSGLSVLGVGWLALRLRTRGVTGPFSFGTLTVSNAITEPHEHEYTHNPGDGYFYCHCGERKKLGG